MDPAAGIMHEDLARSHSVVGRTEDRRAKWTVGSFRHWTKVPVGDDMLILLDRLPRLEEVGIEIRHHEAADSLHHWGLDTT